MSASNNFNLGSRKFTGSNGDVSTSNGNLVVGSYSTPRANAVYVDNDYATLSAKGILAYGTLEDAVASWRSGGAAQVRYGTPSATNPALIIVGAGQIECLIAGNTTQLSIDVDFLTIAGTGKISTVLTTANSITQTMVALSAQHINLYNLTLKGTTLVQGIIRTAVTTYSGVWNNVKVTGDTNTSFVSFGSNLVNSFFYDCEFDFTGTANVMTNAFTISGSASGNIFKFYNCAFSGNSGSTRLLSITGRVDEGNFIDCVFSGALNTALIQTATIYYIGNFQNCIFNSSASSSAIGFQVNDADPEMVFEGCFFQTRGNCITGQFSNRTRILNSFLLCFGSNVDAVSAVGAAGLAISNCRIVTQGTGLAINADGSLTAQITNCTLRKPTVNTAGSSISSNITNAASSGGASNEELESSVNY
jgi:hypothetical protein